MPIAIILIVGLVVFNNSAINKVKIPNQEKVTEVAPPKIAEVKPAVNETKSITKQPEPIKEEPVAEAKQPKLIKEAPVAEAKQSEPIKEEPKVEAKELELIKEEIKEEPKIKSQELITEEAKKDEPDYLKIILYIVGAIAAIFGGFYFFSNRGSNLPTNSTVDATRKDIEENYQPENLIQQPAQEEIKTENQEQQPTEDDENNNKQ